MMRSLTAATIVLACLASFSVAETPTPPYFGLRLAQRDGGKVEVTYADPAGLGSRLGLKKGDVITSFQGKPVTNADDLLKALAALRPGKKETVEVTKMVAVTKMAYRPTSVVDEPNYWWTRSSRSSSLEPVRDFIAVKELIVKDAGEYAFQVHRPAGEKAEAKAFTGTVKVYDEAAYKKIKAAFPDAPIKVGTVYVSPKK
jgi:hypothetical protein